MENYPRSLPSLLCRSWLGDFQINELCLQIDLEIVLIYTSQNVCLCQYDFTDDNTVFLASKLTYKLAFVSSRKQLI